MDNRKDFDNILNLIELTINPKYLNSTQETVLREVWNGKTYAKIAIEHSYDSEYIKTVGCNLWQIISSAFDEQVNKSNFVSFMRQKINNLESTEALFQNSLTKPVGQEVVEIGKYHWNTAPGTENFVGREKEIEQLKLWSEEPECRCIIVSGMIGCGKTSLTTKFAREFKDSFDYVIWHSLDHCLSVEALLNNYLSILGFDVAKSSKMLTNDFGLLITQFVDYLKQHKVLLILDGIVCAKGA